MSDVVIIADDLTGALDAAAPFAARGAVTQAVTSLSALQGMSAGSAPNVVAITTESRHLPAERAASRVAEAIEAASCLKPELWIKKVDSTLRGQVAAECLSANRHLSRALLVAPAVPSQGRTVSQGCVFVHGEPLETTAYVSDACSPAPGGDLVALFEAVGLPMTRCASADMASDGMNCVIDADDATTLDAIADVALSAAGHWLAVGASGLTEAVARQRYGTLKHGSAWSPEGWVVAMGSRSPQARRQIASCRVAFPKLPVIKALEPQAALPSGDALVIPGEAVGEWSATDVASRMAEVLVDGDARNPQPGRVWCVSGGDTAMAVLARYGAERIEVVGEWAPGMVCGYIDGNQPLVTKAGGFGDDGVLAALYRHTTKVADV
ncbi:four-carbon acid sugar kinase family protein [Aidingimonas lacisalsi]|uniref:four-carbon acid sugar kinase family protein n=1 Tax=Aidingimonas lacisalsi TaxID=2604086 RepID=UPI001375FA2E|nr:four-carbon acid sugar kinase family protein [Aidingimonas lacisalsi]